MAGEADGVAHREGDDVATNEFHRDSGFSKGSSLAAAEDECPHDAISSNDGADDEPSMDHRDDSKRSLVESSGVAFDTSAGENRLSRQKTSRGYLRDNSEPENDINDFRETYHFDADEEKKNEISDEKHDFFRPAGLGDTSHLEDESDSNHFHPNYPQNGRGDSLPAAPFSSSQSQDSGRYNKANVIAEGIEYISSHDQEKMIQNHQGCVTPQKNNRSTTRTAKTPPTPPFGAPPPPQSQIDTQKPETSQQPQQPNMITITQSKTAPIPQSKKAMALIKLRAWDPARPTQQFKMIAAAHVLVPLKEDGSVDLGNGEHSSSSSSVSTANCETDYNGEGSLSSSVHSARRRRSKRLSAVKEEMEGELEEFPSLNRKGTIESSFHENYNIIQEDESDNCTPGDEVGANRAVKEDRFNSNQSGNNSIHAKDDDFQEQNSDGDVGSGPPADDQENEDEERDPPHNNLEAGSLIGIQLNPLARHQKHQPATSSLTSSVTSTTSSSHTMRRQFDWAVGQRIHLHKLNLLPFPNWAELYYRIQSNSSSLRELILDGLPAGCMSPEEASVVIEALGPNTSIKRFSMRYARVDDEIASHIALALVENTTLTQLVLEGNSMTDVSVRNFYSVLRKSNESLRLLDVSHNPMINADVAEALEQFMEQRALKRTLNLKAEKAKRAAKGLPPDDSLDEDEDGGNPVHFNSITVVCNPSIIDGTYSQKRMAKIRGASPGSGHDMGPTLFIGSASKTSDVTSLEDMTTCDEDDDDNEDTNYETARNLNPSAPSLEKDALDMREEGEHSLMAEHHPNESFNAFMNRTRVVRADKSDSSSYNQKLEEQSEAGMERFENYGALKNTPDLYPKIQPNPYPSQQNRSLPPPVPRNDPNMRQSNVSFNSSITSRSSPHYVADNDTNSIASEERQGRNGATTASAARTADLGVASAAADQPFPAHLSPHPQSASLPANSDPYPAYRTAFSSLSRGESTRSGFSHEMQQKRRQSSAPDRVGAHQVNEPAPARQSQQNRRNRTRRTESQRRARLAALTGGGDGDENATANANNDGGGANGATAASTQTTTANNGQGQNQTNEILNADIQRLGDEYYRDLEDPDSKNGFFGGEFGADKMICLLMGLLAIAMIVMIVLLVT